MINPISPIRYNTRSMQPNMPYSAAAYQSALAPTTLSSTRPAMAAWPSTPIAPIAYTNNAIVYPNALKTMFHNRQAIVYALNLRTFAATDRNGDRRIDPNLAENGTFLKAIQRLPELKALGINTLHVLPILPVGKIDKMGVPGSPGSVYAPAALDRISEEYRDSTSPLSVTQQARAFVDAAHRLGIKVMIDVPSCASLDLAEARPDLLARDMYGKLITPTDWVDIRMFVKDSQGLREYYQKFFDLMVNQLGVDGFRCDVARARTLSFWHHFISQYPDKAWLAETYTEEDATSMKNIPRDVPEDLLQTGFDSMYGQFHIFQNMNANDYIHYLLQNQALFQRLDPQHMPPQKSTIGSFVTHDDVSGMEQGGATYCKLISGLMSTQPDTNPYILDGFTTGAWHDNNPDNHALDIFNWRTRPQGQNPDIGQFLQRMISIRQNPQYEPILTRGKFIPLQVDQNQQDPHIIAFMRQYGNRTLFVVANKDMNATQQATVNIPGFQPTQPYQLLSPEFTPPSKFTGVPGQLAVNLQPGSFYLFEIVVPPVSAAQTKAQAAVS